MLSYFFDRGLHQLLGLTAIVAAGILFLAWIAFTRRVIACQPPQQSVTIGYTSTNDMNIVVQTFDVCAGQSLFGFIFTGTWFRNPRTNTRVPPKKPVCFNKAYFFMWCWGTDHEDFDAPLNRSREIRLRKT